MFYVQYSWQLALISVIIFIIMIYISRPNNTYKNPQLNNINKGVNIFFLLYIINSVCGFRSSDTYHVWDIFIYSNTFSYFEIDTFELIFNKLALWCENNYFLWRFIIWTPACLFLYLSAKKTKLLNRNFLVALALFLGFASFTRAMLGHSMLLFGLILFVMRRNNMTSRLLGLIVVIISYYFHKSMYVNIIFALLAFYPLRDKNIKLSIILFPFFTIVTTFIVNSISSGTLLLNLGEHVGGAGDRTYLYATQERAVLNIYGIISKIITNLPQYLVLFYLYITIVKKDILRKDRDSFLFVYLFRLTYIAIYIASLFYFTETSSFIYERFKYMGIFPLTIVLAKVWTLEPRSNKLIKIVILTQAFSLLWNNSYAIYDWYRL